MTSHLRCTFADAPNRVGGTGITRRQYGIIEVAKLEQLFSQEKLEAVHKVTKLLEEMLEKFHERLNKNSQA